MTSGERSSPSSRLWRALRASAVVAALVATALPGRAAMGNLPNLGPKVTVGQLPLGGTYIVRPAAGAPVAAIELWYRAPSTGFGPKPTPGLARLAAQVVAASKAIVGNPVGKVIADVGGRLSVTVYGDALSISAVVPASQARDVVKAMTTAFFAPVITDDGYRSAQRDVAQEALISSFDPETAAREAVFSALFSGGPQHYSALGPAKDVAAIALSDVRAFATRAFRARNAILVVSGAVDSSIGGAAVAGRPPSGNDQAEAPVAPQLAATLSPVTKPFSQPTGAYGWLGPPISDERASTALDFIADYLFRPEAGYVTRQIAEKYPDALVTGQFITLHDPGVMFIGYSGKDVGTLKSIVDDGLARVLQPMAPAAFAAALGAFKYHLLSDLQTPSEMADNFGWYCTEGDPEYAPGANGEDGAYFKAANSLTPQFVAAIAEKYLGKAPAVASLAPEKEKPKQQ
jgi:predicted Zn-dependent peptidase